MVLELPHVPAGAFDSGNGFIDPGVRVSDERRVSGPEGSTGQGGVPPIPGPGGDCRDAGEVIEHQGVPEVEKSG